MEPSSSRPHVSETTPLVPKQPAAHEQMQTQRPPPGKATHPDGSHKQRPKWVPDVKITWPTCCFATDVESDSETEDTPIFSQRDRETVRAQATRLIQLGPGHADYTRQPSIVNCGLNIKSIDPGTIKIRNAQDQKMADFIVEKTWVPMPKVRPSEFIQNGPDFMIAHDVGHDSSLDKDPHARLRSPEENGAGTMGTGYMPEKQFRTSLEAIVAAGVDVKEIAESKGERPVVVTDCSGREGVKRNRDGSYNKQTENSSFHVSIQRGDKIGLGLGTMDEETGEPVVEVFAKPADPIYQPYLKAFDDNRGVMLTSLLLAHGSELPAPETEKRVKAFVDDFLYYTGKDDITKVLNDVKAALPDVDVDNLKDLEGVRVELKEKLGVTDTDVNHMGKMFGIYADLKEAFPGVDVQKVKGLVKDFSDGNERDWADKSVSIEVQRQLPASVDFRPIAMKFSEAMEGAYAANSAKVAADYKNDPGLSLVGYSIDGARCRRIDESGKGDLFGIPISGLHNDRGAKNTEKVQGRKFDPDQTALLNRNIDEATDKFASALCRSQFHESEIFKALPQIAIARGFIFDPMGLDELTHMPVGKEEMDFTGMSELDIARHRATYFRGVTEEEGRSGVERAHDDFHDEFGLLFLTKPDGTGQGKGIAAKKPNETKQEFMVRFDAKMEVDVQGGFGKGAGYTVMVEPLVNIAKTSSGKIYEDGKTRKDAEYDMRVVVNHNYRLARIESVPDSLKKTAPDATTKMKEGFTPTNLTASMVATGLAYSNFVVPLCSKQGLKETEGVGFDLNRMLGVSLYENAYKFYELIQPDPRRRTQDPEAAAAFAKTSTEEFLKAMGVKE